MLNKCKILLLVITMTGILIAGCSSKNSQTDAIQITNETTAGLQSTSTTGNSIPAETSTPESSAAESGSASHTSEAAGTINTSANISQETKDYILTGQGDKPDADKIKWSETFLNEVDMDTVYQVYIADGGKAEDIPAFAQYLTLHAPIADNWQEMTAADLLKSYDEKISKIELISDDVYQVYVTIDGADVAYVAVNARTEYFHG